MSDSATGVVQKNSDSETFEYICGGKHYTYCKGVVDPLVVVEKLFSKVWVVSSIPHNPMPTEPFKFYCNNVMLLRFSVVNGRGVVKTKNGERVYWDFPLGEAASNVKNGNWCILPKGLFSTKSLQSLCDKIPGLVVIKERMQGPALKFREFPEVKMEGLFACNLVKVLWALSDEIV